MAEHDRGRDRHDVGVQRHDLALAVGSERRSGAPDEAGIAFVLDQRGAALAFPARGFKPEERFQRGCDLLGPARDFETDGAVFRQPMALTAQLFQFFMPERVAQQLIGVTCRVKAGAEMRLQHMRA